MPINDKEAIVTVLYEDNVPVEIYVERDIEAIRCMDIYVGHVEKVLDATGGAFVRITKDECGYLPANRAKESIFASLKKDNTIKPGDELLVQVETEKTQKKHAVLNCKLKLYKQNALLDEIKEKGTHRTAPSCLYRAPMSWRVLYEHYKDEIAEFVTDSPEVFFDVGEKVRLYDDLMVKLYRLYNFSSLLDESTDKKVWLKSGGYLYIEQTEAFVSIDVNSGKDIKGKASDETFLKINEEAAWEVFLQIRRRRLSGTILVDFISMKSKEANDALLSLSKELASNDPVYTNAVDITPLGIMEITRHKTKNTLKMQIDNCR